MSEYQVVARKYRPQRFNEVKGQEPIVTTLKNAIRFKRLAHAYLFCGSRGTGKTTLARIFAKAINCAHPSEELEPCNVCPSCKEITAGNSLDVLEIDGASNRGIDEIRRLSETVGYTPATGKYKIVLIDEVHMLTKEAFNALLKTLEEPPPYAKFFFATTEPHKVLPTSLSRCQRFNLSRISISDIIEKLTAIAKNLEIEISKTALHLIAKAADGGLRDAESIFDQVYSFSDGNISEESITDILGILSNDKLFALDQAGKESQIKLAFEMAETVFSEGKDISHFFETVIDHFRTILLVQLTNSCKEIPQEELQRYQLSAKNYRQEQLLYILDVLTEAQEKLKFAPSKRVALEVVLMKIIRSHHRIPVDMLVKRLVDLEKTIQSSAASNTQATAVAPARPPQPVAAPPPPAPPSPPRPPAPPPAPPAVKKRAVKPPPPAAPAPVQKQETVVVLDQKNQSKYDTLMQFAKVELEGTLKKNKTKTV